MHETTAFADVDQTVDALNQKYGAENVLIVSDIDNTLLTSSVDLGGDIWYQWQRGKLDVTPAEDEKVNCLFEDTIGLLYELNPMMLTEGSVNELVSKWQTQGNTLMALTSRAPKYRAPTERELYRNGLNLAFTALAPANDSDPVYRQLLEREMSYSRGVMMTTGMNKGEMLHWILNKTGRKFAAIVFIDDSQKNIDSMSAAWENAPVTMEIFHYTKIEDEREAANGSVLTQAQADKMATDYATLEATLNQVFPARATGQCLSIN